MYDERKRRDVRLLLAAEVPQERVAEQLGVSLRTVQRITREMRAEPRGALAAEVVPLPAEPPPASGRAALTRTGPGRPSTVEAYRDLVADLLAGEPGLKSLEVLRRLRERGYGGGKTAVYELVRQQRPRAVRPLCRFEGLAGEFSQHDFGEVWVEYTGGGRERVQFFASRLKHSRYALVTLVPNQRVETLVRALAEHLAGFGGLPLLAVFDRPKTIVTKSDPKTGAALEWNRQFAEALARMVPPSSESLPSAAPSTVHHFVATPLSVQWYCGRIAMQSLSFICRNALWRRRHSPTRRNVLGGCSNGSGA